MWKILPFRIGFPITETILENAMTLEEQLEALAKCGLVLSDGVTIDDLLYSFDRSHYEDEPFDLILFISIN